MRDTFAHTVRTRTTHKPASLASIPPITKKETVRKEVRERGTRLPKDWQPDADDCAYAIDHGLEPQNHRNRFPRLLARPCRTGRDQNELEIDLAAMVQNRKRKATAMADLGKAVTRTERMHPGQHPGRLPPNPRCASDEDGDVPRQTDLRVHTGSAEASDPEVYTTAIMRTCLARYPVRHRRTVLLIRGWRCR